MWEQAMRNVEPTGSVCEARGMTQPSGAPHQLALLMHAIALPLSAVLSAQRQEEMSGVSFQELLSYKLLNLICVSETFTGKGKMKDRLREISKPFRGHGH